MLGPLQIDLAFETLPDGPKLIILGRTDAHSVKDFHFHPLWGMLTQVQGQIQHSAGLSITTSEVLRQSSTQLRSRPVQWPVVAGPVQGPGTGPQLGTRLALHHLRL